MGDIVPSNLLFTTFLKPMPTALTRIFNRYRKTQSEAGISSYFLSDMRYGIELVVKGL